MCKLPKAKPALGSNSIGILLPITLVLLTVSVIINFSLTQRLRAVNVKLRQIDLESKLVEGSKLQDIDARNLDGTPTTFSLSSTSKPTIIYYFSPACGWCRRNEDNFKALFEKKRGDFQFVALSNSHEDLQEYIADRKWEFRTLVEPSDEVLQMFKLSGTPQTIVVSSDGEVLRSWSGAYVGTTQDEVESYFDLKLPGIKK
jgi:peroxiredoxin